jgi:hypothetical protein
MHECLEHLRIARLWVAQDLKLVEIDVDVVVLLDELCS